MNKNMIRVLCAVLALVLAACTAALAASETKTYKTYAPLDEMFHTVTEETWVYPIVNGKPGSGKPVSDNSLGSGKPSGENTYNEPHNFVGGVCMDCGYQAVTFTNAMGVVLAKRTPAVDTLKLVFDAIQGEPSVVNGTVDAGETLTGLVANPAANPTEYLPVLESFPVETVDGVPCNVVTLSYNDRAGNPVTENYAFSTSDATLIKLY